MIIVVEARRRLEVEGGEVVVAGTGPAGAAGLPGSGEGGVDVAVVVDVGSEAGAPSLPNCVGTCNI